MLVRPLRHARRVGSRATLAVLPEHAVHVPGGDYNGDFGGGSFVIDGFTVTARDCQGNATTKVVSEQPVVNEGDQVALVMALGPGRGRASIRIDGTWLTNIDTFAAVNTNRVVVFRRMPAGTHTLTIVNQATPGRPRIDLDAVMTN